MSHVSTSGFEQDILGQPAALEAVAAQPFPAGIAGLNFGGFDRIILTGMGSSDYVTIPLELTMLRNGLPVWRLQTGRVLETPELITDRTLLWITSQSGRSGEVTALLERLPAKRGCTVVATTNDQGSPLASHADHIVELRSGLEATVSSKSYLNSLAWMHRIQAAVERKSDEDVRAAIRSVAHSLRAAIKSPAPGMDDLVRRTLRSTNPRLALVGIGEDAATALTGALILKEAAKVYAEGYMGGEFRHGPMELAGPGLTALLFGTGEAAEITLHNLSRDLVKSGSLTVAIAPMTYQGSEHLPLPCGTSLSRLVHAMHAVQRFCVGLARATGLEPGAFRFGQKITAQL